MSECPREQHLVVCRKYFNETFQLVIASPDGSASVSPPLGVTIADDDAPGANIQIDLTALQQGVGEGAGSVPVSVRIITANGAPTSAAVPLTFSTAPGTAAANADYGSLAGGVTIAAGTASGTVVASAIAIVNDAVDEPLETFTLNISTALPAVSAVPTLTIGIFDDDPGPNGLAAASEGEFAATPPSGETAAGAPTSDKRRGPPRQPGDWTIESPPARGAQPLTWTTDRPSPDAAAAIATKGRQ